MPFPVHYAPSDVGKLYPPRIEKAYNAGISLRAPNASDDSQRSILLLVDPQVDFIHTDGTLSVPGAVADTRRTIEWIYLHLEHITAIAASLDSHVPRQIFYAPWWIGPEGSHPEPFTPITAGDVRAGRWQPLFEQDWSLDYVARLESGAKKTLMIWPFHTMIGTPGHAITPALFEAITFHAGARGTEPIFLQKGTIPQTEHYSIFEPEVKVSSGAGGGLNTEFLQMLAGYDAIYIAGQAKSHCVLETVNSFVRFFASEPTTLCKLHLLTDCMSSVAHPEIDFESLAVAAFAEFEAVGVHLVHSTEKIP